MKCCLSINIQNIAVNLQINKNTKTDIYKSNLLLCQTFISDL